MDVGGDDLGDRRGTIAVALGPFPPHGGQQDVEWCGDLHQDSFLGEGTERRGVARVSAS